MTKAEEVVESLVTPRIEYVGINGVMHVVDLNRPEEITGDIRRILEEACLLGPVDGVYGVFR